MDCGSLLPNHEAESSFEFRMVVHSRLWSEKLQQAAAVQITLSESTRTYVAFPVKSGVITSPFSK